MSIDELISQARTAAERAYAPYSNFRVGAAVELDNDLIITGSNQENAASPSGSCAEQVALNYAKSQYPAAVVLRIVIFSPSSKAVITPCGSCRQVLHEVALRQGTDFEVIMTGSDEYRTTTTSELLPFSFMLPAGDV